MIEKGMDAAGQRHGTPKSCKPLQTASHTTPHHRQNPICSVDEGQNNTRIPRDLPHQEDDAYMTSQSQNLDFNRDMSKLCFHHNIELCRRLRPLENLVTVCNNNEALSSEQGLSSFEPHSRSPHHWMVVLIDLRSWSEKDEDCGSVGISAQLSSTLTRSTPEPRDHGAW